MKKRTCKQMGRAVCMMVILALVMVLVPVPSLVASAETVPPEASATPEPAAEPFEAPQPGEEAVKEEVVDEEPLVMPQAGFTVTYEGNGATGGTAPVDGNPYDTGSSVTTQAAGTLTRVNTVFIGWSQSAVGIVKTAAEETAAKVIAAGGAFVISGNTTLYAVWAEDVEGPNGTSDGVPDYLQYTVTYDSNGGTGQAPIDSNIYKSGDTVTLPGAGAIAKTGACFIGWNPTPVSYVIATTAQEAALTHMRSPGTTFAIMGNTTWYAVWAIDANNDGVEDYRKAISQFDDIPADVRHQSFLQGATLSDVLAKLPASLTGTVDTIPEQAISIWNWHCPGFAGNTPGTYIFTPALPDTHRTIPALALPTIEITIIARYTVTLTAGEGYAIAAQTGSSSPVASGGSYSFTVTPDEGHDIVEVKANGAVLEAAGGVYTIQNITADQTVAVAAMKIPYTVTLTAGEGYAIAAAAGSSSPVTWGGSYSFTVTPNEGYDIVEVKANGAVLEAAGGVYTIQNISVNQTVAVTVREAAPLVYPVTQKFAPYNGDGKDRIAILDAEHNKYEGTTVNGQAAPATTQSGSTVVTLPASYLDTLANGAYTVRVSFTDGYAETTLTVNAATDDAESFIITAAAGTNGSVSPSGSVAVEKGGSRQFIFAPDAGYVVDVVTVDGATVSASNNTYTIADVQKDLTVHVTFKAQAGATATATTTGSGGTTPRTGDDSNISLWIVLIVVAAAMIGLAVYRRRKARQ